MAELIRPTDDTFFTCPLFAFKYAAKGSKRIDLGEGVYIWRIPPIPNRLAFQSYEQIFSILGYNFAEVVWALQLPFNPRGRAMKKNEIIPIMDLFALALDLITVLRLQHDGDVAPGPLLQLSFSNGKLKMGGLSSWPLLFKPGHYPGFSINPYELLETEVDDLREFWQDFRNKRQKGKLDDLKIALGRFNSSYGEGPEDRLLDQMIALESLYLGEEQELKYKLALRAAFLLGIEEEERKQIFENLGKAYKARSRIVHGEERPANLKELVVETEAYLRKSIKHILKLPEQYTLRKLKSPLGKSEKHRDPLFDQNILEAGRLLRV